MQERPGQGASVAWAMRGHDPGRVWLGQGAGTAGSRRERD